MGWRSYFFQSHYEEKHLLQSEYLVLLVAIVNGWPAQRVWALRGRRRGQKPDTWSVFIPAPVQQRVMLHAYASGHWWIWASKVCTPTLPPSLLGGDSESKKKEEAFQRRENLDLMATELHCRDGRADSSWIDPELISMGCLRHHCKNFKCISHI